MDLEWSNRYPSQEVLQDEVRCMTESFFEVLLDEIPPREIRGLYFKGSAQKQWESLLDYVPEVSDVDIHILFSEDDAVQKYPSIEKLYADSAYVGQYAKVVKQRYDMDVEVVRRPTSRWHDIQLPLFEEPAFVPLPKRWVVERTHAWGGRPRRLAKDQDRRLDVATAWLWFTEARVLLRRLAQPLATAAVTH